VVCVCVCARTGVPGIARHAPRLAPLFLTLLLSVCARTLVQTHTARSLSKSAFVNMHARTRARDTQEGEEREEGRREREETYTHSTLCSLSSARALSQKRSGKPQAPAAPHAHMHARARARDTFPRCRPADGVQRFQLKTRAIISTDDSAAPARPVDRVRCQRPLTRPCPVDNTHEGRKFALAPTCTNLIAQAMTQGLCRYVLNENKTVERV
jgi:hypothetical protein